MFVGGVVGMTSVGMASIGESRTMSGSTYLYGYPCTTPFGSYDALPPHTYDVAPSFPLLFDAPRFPPPLELLLYMVLIFHFVL